MSLAEAPLKLLSVIHGPAFGGAHNQALRLREPLERMGVRTLVVLPFEADAAASRLRAAGTQVATMPLGRLRATSSPAVHWRLARSVRRDLAHLRALIAERKIDVVQVHGATNPQGALAARREGAAVTWQLFDTRAPLPLRCLAMPMVVRLSDSMTTWGRELARVHPGAERLGARLTTVYPPVDGREFAPSGEARARARAALGVSEHERLVGAVGVLNPQKGHEWLIRAAELVSARRPDVQFRILGGSSPAHAAYERELRKEADDRGLGDRLRFVDPGGQVASLLQGFDLFAMTSVPRSEGMPTVILEAMHCGKPVVTTDVGAVTELVEPGVTGLVVEPLRPDLVATAILELLSNPELSEGMAAAAAHRAQTKFDLERLAGLHAAAYRTAVAHARLRRGA